MSDVSDVEADCLHISPAVDPSDVIPESNLESDGCDGNSGRDVATPSRVAAGLRKRTCESLGLSLPDLNDSLKSDMVMLKEAVLEMRDALKQLVNQKNGSLQDQSTTSDSSIHDTPKHVKLGNKVRVSLKLLKQGNCMYVIIKNITFIARS